MNDLPSSTILPDSATPSTLYALLLKLRPLEEGAGHSLMPFSGDLVHAAFLNWVRTAAPDVAEWMHSGNKRRLFTCSSLQFPLPPTRMREAEWNNTHLPLRIHAVYTVRITLLLSDLFPLLYDALLHSGGSSVPQGNAPEPFMRLSRQAFLLQEAVMNGDVSGWTGFTSFQTLIEEVKQEQALRGGFASKVFPLTLEFDSLTTFNRSNHRNRKYGNHYAVWPTPFYIFPMLANRWRELAPPELAHYVSREPIEQYILDEGMVIQDYNLHPHRVTFTDHPQRGFVGTCTYHLRGPDDATTASAPLTVRQQILLLARFAFYTGVGYKTPMGMGRVRVLDDARSNKDVR